MVNATIQDIINDVNGQNLSYIGKLIFENITVSYLINSIVKNNEKYDIKTINDGEKNSIFNLKQTLILTFKKFKICINYRKL